MGTNQIIGKIVYNKKLNSEIIKVGYCIKFDPINTTLVFYISKFFLRLFFAVLRSCSAFLQPFHVLISNLDLLKLSMTGGNHRYQYH